MPFFNHLIFDSFCGIYFEERKWIASVQNDQLMVSLQYSNFKSATSSKSFNSLNRLCPMLSFSSELNFSSFGSSSSLFTINSSTAIIVWVCSDGWGNSKPSTCNRNWQSVYLHSPFVQTSKQSSENTLYLWSKSFLGFPLPLIFWEFYPTKYALLHISIMDCSWRKPPWKLD